jgi:DNA polymerase I-like protein with 3'-5' exonuclease and polymerase domains
MATAIDYETHLISAESIAPRPVCLSYKTDTDQGLLKGMHEMEAFLFALFESQELIVAHNAKFELMVTYNHFPNLRPLIWKHLDKGLFYCTQVAQKVLDNKKLRRERLMRTSLADLVAFYLKEDISAEKKDPDAWRLRYAELESVPLEQWPEKAISYALDDSIYAYKIFKLQGGERCESQVRDGFALNLMAFTGISVDNNKVSVLKDEMNQHLMPLYKKLEAANLATKTKTGYKKASKLFREHIESVIEAPIYSPKGTLKINSEALSSYYAKVQDPIIKTYMDIADYEKISTAYVPKLASTDVIKCKYNEVLVTNRTSCSGDKFYPSMNLQQLPREVKNATYDVRNCLVPRPGYELCSIDYNGLEIASCSNQLFTVFGESKMRDLLNAGTKPFDMHNFARELMFLKEGIRPEYEDFVSNKKKSPYKGYRQTAKPVNLSFPGGVGYETMRILMAQDGIIPHLREIERYKNENKVDRLVSALRKEGFSVRKRRIDKFTWALVEDELVEIKNALFRVYPELEEFLKEYHKNFIMRDSLGEALKGRAKNEFGEWEDEDYYSYTVEAAGFPATERFTQSYCTYTAACNGFLMQTPAAIGAKRFMYNVIKKYNDSPDLNPLIFIHDEIVFEFKKGRYDLVQDVAEMMIDSMQEVLPHVRIAVEADCMDYWMKQGGQWSRTYWKNYGDKKLLTDE